MINEPIGIDLYPTKESTIRKMLEGIKLSETGAILEPGGGRGHICDYIKRHHESSSYYSRRPPDLDVIEIDEECQHILRGKGYRVIYDDFLTFETHKVYDLIIANFPFSVGDQHLQKAISLLQRSGGRLRCLVNAETIRNPYTNLRLSLVRLLEKLGAEIDFFLSPPKLKRKPASLGISLSSKSH